MQRRQSSTSTTNPGRRFTLVVLFIGIPRGRYFWTNRVNITKNLLAGWLSCLFSRIRLQFPVSTVVDPIYQEGKRRRREDDRNKNGKGELHCIEMAKEDDDSWEEEELLFYHQSCESNLLPEWTGGGCSKRCVLVHR